MPDGTIEKAEGKQLINSFGYAIYSTKEENKEVIGDQNAQIQGISLENKSSTSIKNLSNVMKACKNANILVLSFDFSKQSILNSILESAGVYSDLKLNNKLFDLWNSSSDDSIRQALKKYEGMPCKNVLLGGSSGTMRTRLLSQILSIKICTEVEKPLRIIAVLNVPSKTSKIIQDISIKFLNFCDHLKTKSGTNIDIQFQTLQNLKYSGNFKPDIQVLEEVFGPKRYNLLTENGWLPRSTSLRSLALEICHIGDPYDFWENNNDADLLSSLNKESNFTELNMIWLEKELGYKIPKKLNPLTTLRRWRHDYLFDAFLHLHWIQKKTCFVLQELMKNFTETSEEGCRNIILLDGCGKLMFGESHSMLKIPNNNSFDFLLGIDNPTSG